jgi:2-dehydro-3-deoxyphosphooctonate aldolase (KDO 8-P synthase)
MNKNWVDPVELTSDVKLGAEKLILIAGPCAIESLEICLRTAEALKKMTERLGIGYIFKSSFDKANRTSGSSFRSIGFDESLEILAKVRCETSAAVLTDVHESNQVNAVAQVADVLQIPAFLCRQTDLLLTAGQSGRAVNIKKGQFMAPEDMRFAVEKVQGTSNRNVFLTERGTTLGYHNLVVDMRSLPIMRQFAPVVFDVTHSVQMPGGLGGSSGGQREFAPYLARAAAAAGVDGFFIETHPDPEMALSDGPNSIPLEEMSNFLAMIMCIWESGKRYISEWNLSRV